MSKSKLLKIVPSDFRIDHLWNAVAFKTDRPLVKRDYVYASELGMPICDRILKMAAVKPSNPPNNRSMRKFLMGNILEHIVKQILIASGVYKHDEIKIDAVPYLDCLPCHGRMDFKIGGYIDGAEAIDRLNNLNLPDYLDIIGRKLIESLAGATLKEKIMELKSCSTFAFDYVFNRGAAMANHTLQTYHYQKNAGMEAIILYCCKDDARLAQFNVDSKTTEPLYRADLEQITYYFKNKRKKPSVEPLAKFDITSGNFSKNFGVEYSGYLQFLYGFKNPEDYRDAVKFVLRWNRALSRYALAEQGKTTPTGKKIEITANNKAVAAEIKKAGYSFEECLKCKIAAGIGDEESEN